MAVSVHVAPHPEALVALLCDELAKPPADPFAAELIAVPTRGIERWLTQRIATGLADRGRGDGICANVRFPAPDRLVRDVLLTLPDLESSVTAWEGAALTGHVLDTVDAHIAEPWMRLIARYVDGDGAGTTTTRFAAAAKIVRLFARYACDRPGMIRNWAAGADVGPLGDAIAAADAWQPRLWRLVRERIGVPALPEVLPAGLEPLRGGEVDVDVPSRLAVYGLTAADSLDLEVLVALGVQRDVNLYVLHPSPALWRAVTDQLASVTGRASAIERPADITAELPRHPMLASWGRNARELQVVLAAHDLAAEPIDAAGEQPATLLERLQRDVRANRQISHDARIAAAVAGGSDRSIQIHVTHGARRQVEVLRDAILHVLDEDPTLEPRDVVVMSPDLTTFAPLLEAAFPAAATDGEGPAGLPDLRLRIADRSPAAINPLVRFAATVLDMAGSRLETAVVRELVSRPVVQQRFGFDHDGAAEIARVIDDAAISWGFDQTHRDEWSAGATAERTWQRGLERALSGVFYDDSAVRIVSGTVPLSGIEGQEATPVGLLATLIDRLDAIRTLFASGLPASQWAAALADSVRLLASPRWGDEWQLTQLERLLADTFPSPEPGVPDPVLSLAEARTAIAPWTADRPSPLHFRTGDVTVCTLVPMRSVPYRVVCLLGMDDDRFPRSSRNDGDDLLLADERIGDFDRSAEDRQLLLDALMAAGDHLIVTYAGRDQLTNAELPPAVPIAELLDALGDLVGPEAFDELRTVHPLQTFSAANFTPDALNRPAAFGFDAMQLAGARAVEQRPEAGATVSPPSWPGWAPPDVIDLADLISFLEHPARRFMQNRIGFVVPERSELPDDTLPTRLAPLDAWAVKERLIAGLGDGHSIAELLARERAGDGLPPGRLGDDDVAGAVDAATALWDAAVARGYDRGAMEPYRGMVAVGPLTLEGGVVADPQQGHLMTVTASRVKARQRLRTYARLCFLTALEPEVDWRAVILGRRDGGAGHVAVTLQSLGDTVDNRLTAAISRLGALLALYVEGHRTPLPLPCESAYAWQRYVASDRGKAWGRAREAWETDRFNPEGADPAHLLLLPGLDTMAKLLDSGFEDYCRRLWGPIVPLLRERNI